MSGKSGADDGRIDRRGVVTRHNPRVTEMDTLASLTVGNGGFAMTVDATGLQTFPEYYSNGVPLGTMSEWGWHSFPNTEGFTAADALEEKDFGRGHTELYSAQFKQPGRAHEASEWLRRNPHRLHLGVVGFDFARQNDVESIEQTLDLWTGKITSRFLHCGKRYRVETLCHAGRDLIAAQVTAEEPVTIRLRFPYPTGAHSDDGCCWGKDALHSTSVVSADDHSVVLKRQIDSAVYYVKLAWDGKATVDVAGSGAQRLAADSHAFQHEIRLESKRKSLSLTCEWRAEPFQTGAGNLHFSDVERASADSWRRYWTMGGFADFSRCADKRAWELERRVILSLYLMRAQEAGNMPPQETGLTYNSWFGKFHLEMEWWHQAHYALWGRPELLDRGLNWYFSALPKAQSIARRQGFRGARWMKMTDPSAEEAPSNVGSYLVWQQPHVIYLAELLRRAGLPGAQSKYQKLVDETADFMQSFAFFDEKTGRYVLKGCIPAQETLKAGETVNPPFELNYWLWALQTAQDWHGDKRYQDVIDGLPPLAFNGDSLYLAAESAVDTYRDERLTSDHPALLGALGVLPESRLTDKRVMKKTLEWILDNWNWDKTWGWDYPMAAMTAVRLGEREHAVDALLMPMRTNTYLKNGHNYQDRRLRVYLPGNGGLLTAVALMCAGWEGCGERNPGFPRSWDVRWEGLLQMP